MILKGYSNLINFMVMPEKCNAKGVKLLKIKTGIRMALVRFLEVPRYKKPLIQGLCSFKQLTTDHQGLRNVNQMVNHALSSI